MLLEYRLGEMDEIRVEEIDERLIGDEEFAAAMQAAEYDLLDAYAAGELSLGDRARVERALEPQGRFSPAVSGLVAGRSKVAVMPVRGTLRRKTAAWKWVLPIAAALLLGALLPLARRGERGESQGALAAPSPAAGTVKVVVPEAHVALVLLPSAVRGTAPVPVLIGPGVDHVQFQWAAPNGLDEPRGYDLHVVSSDGKPECRAHGTTAVSGAVDFLCPAAAIAGESAFVRVMEAGASPKDVPLMEMSITLRR